MFTFAFYRLFTGNKSTNKVKKCNTLTVSQIYTCKELKFHNKLDGFKAYKLDNFKACIQTIKPIDNLKSNIPSRKKGFEELGFSHKSITFS